MVGTEAYQKTLYHALSDFIPQVVDCPAILSIVLERCAVSLDALQVTVKDSEGLETRKRSKASSPDCGLSQHRTTCLHPNPELNSDRVHVWTLDLQMRSV